MIGSDSLARRKWKARFFRGFNVSRGPADWPRVRIGKTLRGNNSVSWHDSGQACPGMKKTDTITVSLALQDNGPAVKERK